MEQPIKILKALNLYNNRKSKPFINDRVLNELKKGIREFEWINLANHEVEIGSVLKLVEFELKGNVPRSGHIGDWRNIQASSTGLLDYNFLVCANNRFGYPLLHDFSTTENNDLSSGDTIYLPGSEITTTRRKLKLYTYDGFNYTICNRKDSFFVPFTFVEKDGEFISLTKFHQLKNSELSLRLKYNADLIIENQEEYIRILRVFLEELIVNNSSFLMKNIISHFVGMDAQVIDCSVSLNNNKILLNNQSFSIDDLIQASLIPYQFAMQNSSMTLEQLVESSEYYKMFPLLSNSFTIMLTSIFESLYFKDDNIKFHFHWGAIGMAGYPPEKKGYFKTNSKIIRRLLIQLQKLDNHFVSIFFLLIPVLPFIFYSKEKGDALLIEKLFEKCTNLQAIHSGSEAKFIDQIDRTVKYWLAENHADLSTYFLSKFAKNRCIYNSKIHLNKNDFFAPKNMPRINYRLLSLITGSLHKYGDMTLKNTIVNK